MPIPRLTIVGTDVGLLQGLFTFGAFDGDLGVLTDGNKGALLGNLGATEGAMVGLQRNTIKLASVGTTVGRIDGADGLTVGVPDGDGILVGDFDSGALVPTSVDGASEDGIVDGKMVGVLVTKIKGGTVDVIVGQIEGISVGEVVGSKVCLNEGTMVGSCGTNDGFLDGLVVGSLDGFNDGDSEG